MPQRLEVRQLLAGSHRQAEAQAKLRELAIVDGAIRGELQPGEGELRQLVIAGSRGLLDTKA